MQNEDLILSDRASPRMALIQHSIECLERRRDGESVQEIADSLGLTTKQVHRYINKGLRASIPATHEALRQLEVYRLEELSRLLLEEIKLGLEGHRVNSRLVDMYLRAGDQRARLLQMYTTPLGPMTKNRKSKEGVMSDGPDIIELIRDSGATPSADEVVPTSGEDLG